MWERAEKRPLLVKVHDLRADEARFLSRTWSAIDCALCAAPRTPQRDLGTTTAVVAPMWRIDSGHP